MDSTCLQKITAKFEIDLHPSKLADVRAGIQEHLNGQVTEYSHDFEGMVVAIGDFKLLTKQAMVHPYFPYCRVGVKAPVILFTPKQGSTLTGKVIQIGNDYIGLVLLGLYNASIPAKSIRKEFSFDKDAGEWRSSKHPSHVIGVGSHVRFTVDSVDYQQRYLAVFGSLKSKKTGSLDYLGAGDGEEDQGASIQVPADGCTPGKGKGKDRATGKDSDKEQVVGLSSGGKRKKGQLEVEGVREGKKRKRKEG